MRTLSRSFIVMHLAISLAYTYIVTRLGYMTRPWVLFIFGAYWAGVIGRWIQDRRSGR